MHRDEIYEITLTLMDLRELIKKYGVKAVVEEMDETLMSNLDRGMRSFYIKRANEILQNHGKE